MENYILIQKTESRMPLLAHKDHPYHIKFGKYGMNLCAYDESWICVCVCDESKFYMISGFLKEFCQDLTAKDIDAFAQQFRVDHPLTKIKRYNYKQVPLIATETDNCVLKSAIFNEDIYLTLQDERNLMHIICNGTIRKYDTIIKWFDDYCDKYAIHARLKRDQKYESEELAGLFCLVHGISEDMLSKTYVPFYKSLLGACVLAIAVALWLYIVQWLLDCGGFVGFLAIPAFGIPLIAILGILKK